MNEERTNRDIMVDVIERFIRRETGDVIGNTTLLATIREQATELTTWLDDAGLLRRSATEEAARGMVYVGLRDEPATSSQEITTDVTVDLNDDLEVVGVEVIPAATVSVDGVPVTVDRVTLRELPTNSYGTEPSGDPAGDPVGALRVAGGDHLYLKLARPTNEPWHLIYVAGDQRWSGWQSDADLVGSVSLDRVPVELALPEAQVTTGETN